MNQENFDRLVRNTIAGILKLLALKGGEYAGPVDRLGNFKRGAELTGTTPLQVAFVYASKHYDGIATYVRKDSKGQLQATSEPIEGRLDDLINYCILMKGIIQEQTNAQPEVLSPSHILGAAQTDKESKPENANNNSSRAVTFRCDFNNDTVAIKTATGWQVLHGSKRY